MKEVMKQLRNADSDYRAALASPTVPEGYVLVPIEPTDAMVEAMFVGMVEDQSVPHQLARRRDMKAKLARAIAAGSDNK